MKLKFFSGLLVAILFVSCYNYRWNSSVGLPGSAQDDIVRIFENAGGCIHLDTQAPGYDYVYDIGEKSEFYSHPEAYRFTDIQLTLCDKMPDDKILANFSFKDKAGNEVYISEVDLLRLTPKIDAEGPMVYPELLLEEFNRFGLNFRAEHGEFELESSDPYVANSTYRANITNNCLAGGKWEFALTEEDYSDFNRRVKSDINLNQNRLLSHSWFYIPADLYAALLKAKNPGKDLPDQLQYNDLSDIAEEVVVDFESLRGPLKNEVEIELLEIGHLSERPLLPLDVEQHFKKEFGLLLDSAEHTYSSILDIQIETTMFQDRGYYITEQPKSFKLDWMRYMDQVEMDVIHVPGSDAYVQINLTGEWSPYDITIGNVDMALINEQKLYGMLFGINTYPKSRRYNPVQSTIAFDAELLPEDRQPFVLLTDKKTGQWVNNQYKGIEKIYLTYNSLEMDVLNIYVLSYERITPVWMASVKLPKNLREIVRIRKKLYNN